MAPELDLFDHENNPPRVGPPQQGNPQQLNDLQRIINTPLPAFHANIRDLTRKEWVAHVRQLLAEVGIKGISVTAPSYSMASSIHIRIPGENCTEEEHLRRHAEIDEAERNNGTWMGYGTFCEYCKEHNQARLRIEAIILAAFPDLNDRGDPMSDYSYFCLSIS